MIATSVAVRGLALLAAAGAVAACAARPQEEERRVVYPETEREDVVETLHGVEIADPYRWLEDLDSERTADWVARQNAVTSRFLDGIPERAAIRRRLEQLWDHEKFDTPWTRGGRVFFRRNDGLQNQSVLHVAASLDAEPRVLLDPNALSADGTVALGHVSASPDGTRIAYALQEAGSDWITWRVRDVDTGEDLPDTIAWSKFSGASWAKDGSGFYYSAYDPPAAGKEYEGANYDQRLWFHRLGTAQSDDALVFEDPEHPERGFGGQVTDDGRYLVIHVWQGTARENRLYYVDLAAGGQVVRLLDGADASYEFLGNVGSVFFLKTDLLADRGRVVAIDLAHPGRESWREVVPEAAENLSAASLVGGRVVCSYLRDAHSLVRVHETDGTPAGDVELPGVGSVWGFEGRVDEPQTFYGYADFTTPFRVYRYDVLTGRSTLWRKPDVAFDPARFETRQVFVPSKDGTAVPMFITHRKGLEPDGSNPTYLYGYGGFNIPLTPGFSVSRLVWMEMGGVFAVANLRGGGEYGEEWHEAGTKERKQNVFDDFAACAEWLIAEGWTSTPKLAIGGGSNGGLLVGASMTQRPELFGACIPEVGVLDMLRFHKFTIGWAWTSDYGSPDDPEMFRHLLAYSPLHNLRDGVCYPPTLIVTGDHDDRVVPSHSFKPTAKVLDELADKRAFLVRVLEIDVPDPLGE